MAAVAPLRHISSVTGSVLWFAGELGFGPRSRRKDVSRHLLLHAISTADGGGRTLLLLLAVPSGPRQFI